MKNKIIIVLITFITLAFGNFVAFAGESFLSKARVSYRTDGGISITYFLSSSCSQGETEDQCMTRVFLTNSLKDLPYDDVLIDELPKNREDRDKWRGSKGQEIWVDTSLVTKNEKIEELKEKLDEELEKDNPDTSKVLKLQHQLEKTKDIKNNVLTQEDLAKFEERQQSFLAAAVTAVGELFEGILNSLKEGILALKSLVTDKIQVGTSEKPSGITTYDHETGEPYCLIVKKGKVESIPGECGTNLLTSQDDNSPSNPPSSSSNSNESNSTNNAEEADTDPPTITLIGNHTLEIEIGATYSDPGATISDNVNDNLGYKVIVVRTSEVQNIDGNSGTSDVPNIENAVYPNDLVLDTSQPAEYTITYIAVDQAGNIGTAIRTVRVIASEAKQSNNDVNSSMSSDVPNTSGEPVEFIDSDSQDIGSPSIESNPEPAPQEEPSAEPQVEPSAEEPAPEPTS